MSSICQFSELRKNSGTQFAPDVVEALPAVIARESPVEQELALTAPPADQATGGRSITVSNAS